MQFDINKAFGKTSLNKIGKQSFTTRFNIICNLKYQYSKLVSRILDNHLQFPTLPHKFKFLFCTVLNVCISDLKFGTEKWMNTNLKAKHSPLSTNFEHQRRIY